MQDRGAFDPKHAMTVILIAINEARSGFVSASIGEISIVPRSPVRSLGGLTAGRGISLISKRHDTSTSRKNKGMYQGGGGWQDRSLTHQEGMMRHRRTSLFGSNRQIVAISYTQNTFSQSLL